MKRGNKKNNQNQKEKKLKQNYLPPGSKNYIFGIIIFLIAIIISLSFFERAGIIGEIFLRGLKILIGNTVFFLPFILILTGLVFFFSHYKNFLKPLILALFLLIIGISGIFNYLNTSFRKGGTVGYFLSLLLFKIFGPWLSQILFLVMILIGSLIIWYLLKPQKIVVREEKESLIKRVFKKVIKMPRLKVKEIPPPLSEKEIKPVKEEPVLELKTKPLTTPTQIKKIYQTPPLDLLEEEKGHPISGDVRQNSAIIKKTLESFDIPVEMAEVNIGPTVTQYTLKPADGIKLSKITTLANDLALALASHPIRIEAPIPGKSLVGIEVPNRIRAKVRLKSLISNPQFQNSPSNLTIVLGRDVSGTPIYADLARMPHLLVAGSTGTGKSIFLNSLIITLLYRNSPQILRFILVDPKRVEFPIYEGLPHLLCPVIFGPQKTVNALKWLVSEMERRFELLAEAKTRDINGYNEITLQNNEPPLPYIVLIIDELADLMAARGKEIEAGIVRLAQMARAVGIHLVVATQRPSVEVITGLIKANITSRITFQVASQVDSRTVLDMAGAEKLLGLGDMLFISAEIVKPKRIQGIFVSEKEIKRVINWIKNQNSKLETEKIEEKILENQLAEDLERSLKNEEGLEVFPYGEDPLYEEAERVVIETKRASASLLQRKLRIGYARAARLIDMLEERGVVGPADGAKPREVYFKKEEEDWKKV